MLTVKKINSQHFSIGGDIPLRNDLFRKTIWKHSKYMKNYIFSRAYKKGSWNGRVQVFSPTRIRAGYLREVLDLLDGSGHPYTLDWEDSDGSTFTYEDFYNFCVNLIEIVKPAFKEKHNIDLEVRDYQIDAAWKFLSQKEHIATGIALHATSAGKSLTIAFILGFLFFKGIIQKAVILVPLQSLVTQFYGDLLDFGFSEKCLGKLYANEKQTNRAITIAMNPSTHKIIGTAEESNFFDDVDLVICDEVHKASAKTVTESVLRFHNAKYFFGCTGTLPEDELDLEIINSMFGEVLDKRKLKELREEYNAVSKVKVGILQFCYGMKGLLSRAKGTDSHMDWHEEVEFLQNDFEFRNPYIVQTILNNYERGHNIVVLVKNIEYGLKMYHKIEEGVDRSNRKRIYWIDGSMKLEDRDDIIKKCRKTKKPYIIVTNFQIFSTGVNIRNINCVFCIDAGKSKITVAQTIGRGVRKDHDKNEVLIFDCSCDLKYGNRHGRKRKKLYEEEGFTVFEKVIYKNDDENLRSKFESLR